MTYKIGISLFYIINIAVSALCLIAFESNLCDHINVIPVVLIIWLITYLCFVPSINIIALILTMNKNYDYVQVVKYHALVLGIIGATLNVWATRIYYDYSTQEVSKYNIWDTFLIIVWYTFVVLIILAIKLVYFIHLACKENTEYH